VGDGRGKLPEVAKAAHDAVEGIASLARHPIMKTRYLFLEFVAGNGRKQLETDR
jgi:hypothetical protein